MKDISILAFFGINTDELESYELEDKDPEAISIAVTKRKVMLPCPNCGTLTNNEMRGVAVPNDPFEDNCNVCPRCNKYFTVKVVRDE